MIVAISPPKDRNTIEDDLRRFKLALALSARALSAPDASSAASTKAAS